MEELAASEIKDASSDQSAKFVIEGVEFVLSQRFATDVGPNKDYLINTKGRYIKDEAKKFVDELKKNNGGNLDRLIGERDPSKELTQYTSTEELEKTRKAAVASVARAKRPAPKSMSSRRKSIKVST